MLSSKYVHRAVAESREKKPVSRFADSTEAPSPIERLGKAEKAAENFVAEKLQQVRAKYILHVKVMIWGTPREQISFWCIP